MAVVNLAIILVFVLLYLRVVRLADGPDVTSTPLRKALLTGTGATWSRSCSSRPTCRCSSRP